MYFVCTLKEVSRQLGCIDIIYWYNELFIDIAIITSTAFITQDILLSKAETNIAPSCALYYFTNKCSYSGYLKGCSP